MLPKSVSPRFVGFAAVALAILLSIPLIPLEPALSQLLPPRGGRFPTLVCALQIYYFTSLVLVPRALSYLGIAVRSRSVERFHAADCADGPEAAIDLPIRIIRLGPRVIRITSITFFLAGFACLQVAWFQPPEPAGAFALLGLALMTVGLIATQAQPAFVCEISEEGICAPDGFWGRETFVPWAELARYEIVHDDETVGHDYCVLWDRSGRCRFKASKDWLVRPRRSERARFLRALRSRFPQKGKPEQNAEPALAAMASSAVWDRELDG